MFEGNSELRPMIVVRSHSKASIKHSFVHYRHRPVRSCRFAVGISHYMSIYSVFSALSLLPLMMWLRSPTGSASGKSTAARICTKIRYQPAMIVTNVKDPPVWSIVSGCASNMSYLSSKDRLTICSLCASWTFPFASCQYAPASASKPMVRVKRMVTKATFVLRLARKRKKVRIPMKRK